VTSWLSSPAMADAVRRAQLDGQPQSARLVIEHDQGEDFADDLCASLNADIARLKRRQRSPIQRLAAFTRGLCR
jgi:hypothetical protein